MISKFLSFFICIFCFSQCWAENASQRSAEDDSENTEVAEALPDPNEYVDLHSVPLFREAYKRWRLAKTQGDGLDPLSVIWELALQHGVYLDVSQKLADHIAVPDESTQSHWAIPDIISILLAAKQFEKAKPWIESLQKMDEKLVVPLYPLIAITPDLEVDGLTESKWKNYQLQAFTKNGVEHIKYFQKLMAEKEKYNHDQLVVLMVENSLLR